MNVLRTKQTGADGCPLPFESSEESKRLGGIADQHVLGLLVMVQHHLVRLAPDARRLIAAEGCMGGIGVVAVRPHAPGLDGAPETIGAVAVVRPHACAKTVERIVGDSE